jgi:cytoskeletal protein CcmA (bactofilin family)
METAKTGEFANIGKSVVIKGELSGSEDLYIDGQVSGSIDLHGNSLTIGPNGQVQADIKARGVIIQGKLEGNVQASDRLELRKSAIMMGDIVTERIAIEDGAYLKGKVDIQKETAKAEVKMESRSAAPAGSPPSGSVGPAAVATAAAVAPPHTASDQKK